MSDILLTKFDLLLAQASVFVILSVYLFSFNRQYGNKSIAYFALGIGLLSLALLGRWGVLYGLSHSQYIWLVPMGIISFIIAMYSFCGCLLIGVLTSLNQFNPSSKHLIVGFFLIVVTAFAQASVLVWGAESQLLLFHLQRTVTEFILGCSYLAILLVIISSQVHWTVSSLLMIVCAVSSLRLFAISFTSIFMVQDRLFQRINSDMLAIDLSLMNLACVAMIVWAYGIERKKADSARDQVKYLDTFDQLTGAVKRVELIETLPRYLKQANLENRKVLVINVDLRHFKFVNDSFGLKAGDYVLGEVVKRVSTSILKPQFVARLSGDSFAIIIETSKLDTDEEYQLNHIHSLIERPFLYKQDTIRLGASLGYAIFPEHGTEAEDLLQKANLALFRAELKLLPSVCYEEGMQEKGRRLLRVREELDVAFREDQFKLYVQPQLCLTTNQMIGAEVLLRWQHPEKGFIPPGLFLEDIDELGMSARLDKYVIKQVINLMSQWRKQGFKRVPVAINVGAATFESDDIIEYLEALLLDANVNPRLIELEITETTAMSNIEKGQHTLEQLNLLGLSVSIDDFGTGHSSLSYLKHLKASKIKIDRSFISQIGDGNDDHTMVKAVVDLVKGLHKKVLAEGVETQEQLALLKAMGCDYIQGYLYAKPMSVEDFESYLKP